jgi:N-acetylglutamate synthase-like GNAT family acetyltransferase
MSTPNLQVRRATIEDLSKLLALWKAENLPTEDLEKRFKEFQVIESADGKLIGAVGLQLSGLEGRLHSEVFAHPDQADALREKLWERTQVLAANHGLLRVWTQMGAPFWRQNGFQAAPAELLTKVPPSFGGESRPWHFLQLKDETEPAISLDKEFAMFREAEKERTQKLFRQARILKIIAAVLAVALGIIVAVWAWMFIKARSRLHQTAVKIEFAMAGRQIKLIRVIGAADHWTAGDVNETHGARPRTVFHKGCGGDELRYRQVP